MSILSGVDPAHSKTSVDRPEVFYADVPLSEELGVVLVPWALSFLSVSILGRRLLHPLEGASGIKTILVATALCVARQVAAVAIGYLVYPATRLKVSKNLEALDALKRDGYVVKQIRLNRVGVTYDATLIGHKKTIGNGKWTIHALGNGMTKEMVYDELPRQNNAYGGNTLLINGPSVGESGGWPTRYQLGAGFEAGLQYLEKKICATHIVMHGLSLGGGMLAEAITQHNFARGVKYLFVADRTFGTLSSVAAALVGAVVRPIFYFAGMELDGVSAAARLRHLRIPQIIIQHRSEDGSGHDGVIPDKASLAYQLHRHQSGGSIFDECIPRNLRKLYLESETVTHNGPLPRSIKQRLDVEIRKFFGTNSLCSRIRRSFSRMVLCLLRCGPLRCIFPPRVSRRES